MHSKHLISVVPLLLSIAACSSSGGGEPTGSGGKTDASGGKPTANGGATSGGSSSGGTTTGSGGSSSGGNTTGSGGASKGGSSNGGQTGSSGGSSSGGNSTGMGGGSANSGGKTGSGGAGGASTGSGGTGTGMGGMTGSSGSTGMAVKCDNLSLKPSMTGVAKPSGAAGGLKVLDWAGFKGAVSYTFDDNNPSQVSQYSKLKATGGHVTFFVIGMSVNASQFKPFLADGQEIANHSFSHSQSPQDPAGDMKQAQTKIQTDFGVTAISMAAPNCATVWGPGGKGLVFFNREPCGGSVPALSPRDGTDAFKLPAYLPPDGMKDNASATQSNLVAQHAAGKWRIFVIHGFDTANGTYQPINADGTAAAMSDAIKNGFWVEGMSNVGAYWQGQKMISATATTNATWTLPAQFPKNMCVRITTTGGTVTQKGQAIPWDDHGYYEIGLDAGEVTIQ